jgi:hypothetical protein
MLSSESENKAVFLIFFFILPKEKTVILLQFSHWPHNGVPADPSVLLGKMSHVIHVMNVTWS